MIDILVDQGIVDPDALDTAKKLKRQKLQQWSNIFSTHRDSIDD
jgi:hypothetical protein